MRILTLKSFFILSVLFWAMLVCRYDFHFVRGNSMLPSIYPKSLLMSDPFLDENKLVNGDIVILEVKGKLILKRLIAQNGDLLSIKNSTWSLNGHEPEVCKTKEYTSQGKSWDIYCQAKESSEFKIQKIKVNHYFFMGDNRGNSVDSRHFGEVPKIQLKSKVVKIWEPESLLSKILYNLKAYWF